MTLLLNFILKSVYISKISENGPAALDQRLQVGDKLLSVSQQRFLIFQ